MRSLRILIGVCVCSAALTATPAPESERGTRTLWRDPGRIAERNLYWGMGNASRVPKPPFTFVEEDTSGNRPKIKVKDANGVQWTAKLRPADPLLNEVQPEIAATRLVWALGYFVDENYYVPSGRILGVPKLTRWVDDIGPDGHFKAARFERRDPALEKVGEWDIEKNEFVGTKELSGFLATMLLLNSWDVKPANTVIFRTTDDTKDEFYIMSDLGSTFGSMEGASKRSRWDLEKYRATKYVTGIVKRTLFQFRFPLLQDNLVTIPLEHARWFSGLASQLTDAQLRQAFEAAGATPAEVKGFSSAVRAKIVELKTAVDADSR